MSRPIDLATIRSARARLDAIAEAYPHLLGAPDAPSQAAWELVLRGAEDSMPPTVQIAVRLPHDLLEKIDAYAEEAAAARPGLPVTRADAVRMLLTAALATRGAAPKRRGRGRGR